jgi:hypothetical protein
VDDGDAAGCNAATACGVALADGNFGASELSASAVSVDDCSHGFHQVQRGPDWQPANPATMPASISEWTADRFISLPSTSTGTKHVPSERRKSASLTIFRLARGATLTESSRGDPQWNDEVLPRQAISQGCAD